MTEVATRERRITVAATTRELVLDAAQLLGAEKIVLDSAAAELDIYLKLQDIPAGRKIQLEVPLAANTKTRFFCAVSAGAPGLTANFVLGRASTLDVFSALKDTGAHIGFNAIVTRGAEAHFTGLTEVQKEQSAAIEVHVHHTEGDNLTWQKFYSYAADTSSVAFTGRITVSPGAGGAVAHQLHRGVILDDGARIDAKPFLNIMHDDVRCAHGSTVGFIDQDARHYLMARGIAPAEAEQILILSSQMQFYAAIPHTKAANFFGYAQEII